MAGAAAARAVSGRGRRAAAAALLAAGTAWADPGGGLTTALRAAGPGVYEFEGRFRVEASSEAVWSVLTDYERIEAFVPGMRSSRVARRDADGLRVEQEGVGRFLLFKRTFRLLLDVREPAPWRIEFRDTLGEHFTRYEGSWTLERAGPGWEVRYRLLAAPVTAVPEPFVRAALRSSARGLLESVRDEILRREAARGPE